MGLCNLRSKTTCGNRWAGYWLMRIQCIVFSTWHWCMIFTWHNPCSWVAAWCALNQVYQAHSQVGKLPPWCYTHCAPWRREVKLYHYGNSKSPSCYSTSGNTTATTFTFCSSFQVTASFFPLLIHYSTAMCHSPTFTTWLLFNTKTAFIILNHFSEATPKASFTSKPLFTHQATFTWCFKEYLMLICKVLWEKHSLGHNETELIKWYSQHSL